jgi:hypothetical protein
VESVWFEMLYVFADIRSLGTERTVALSCGLIQIRKRTIAFYASASNSWRKKLPTRNNLADGPGLHVGFAVLPEL